MSDDRAERVRTGGVGFFQLRSLFCMLLTGSRSRRLRHALRASGAFNNKQTHATTSTLTKVKVEEPNPLGARCAGITHQQR
jgi:hypothetical protein